MIESPSTQTVRQATLRTVMHAVWDQGPISRAELARITGLSKQTMSEVVRELEEGDWLRVTGRTQGNVGRSAVTYEIQAKRALILGVDLGGTKIHAALADMEGSIVSETVEKTDPRGGLHVIEQIARLSDNLAQSANVDARTIRVGVVGIPGAFNPRTKRLIMVPNISGFEQLAFEEELGARLGFRIVAGNDVNMAAKGEQWLGEGKSTDSFVFIAVGTGIGMGIINERRIVSGARGAAGEISTLPIGADPYDARTFKSGALESAIGSAAICSRYTALGGLPDLSVREIFDRLGEGDSAAIATIDEVARTLAVSVLAVSAVLDPQKVIFGGSVGARSELVERVAHHLARCMPDPVDCTISRLGSSAGLSGTIAIALEHLREILFEVPATAPEKASSMELEPEL
ncbi:ROK family transcriptional regulator [Mesorhizobium sp. SB112]|uniref:ROK family transcriptional regulator n=1 Tax=Mesorhizobium sp. SB112 TaxID=3151853 RepID=UPI0032630095